jgi:hypothetical protein
LIFERFLKLLCGLCVPTLERRNEGRERRNEGRERRNEGRERRNEGKTFRVGTVFCCELTIFDRFLAFQD